MNLVGIPLATLMQIGAVAGGFVVALYILKLRRRPIAVPFSKIWQQILRDKQATSLFSQLKRLLSLLLQLALLALMLLALGDPQTARDETEGRNVVVLVDASASMQATDVEPTRLEVARRELRELVRDLGGDDRMLVAQMDAAIVPLSTLTGDRVELQKAVEGIHGSETRTDFGAALRFATDTLRDLPNAEIVIVSDGALEEPVDSLGPVELGDVKLSFVHVGGKSQRNAAITGFSVRRYPLDKSRCEVMLEITNMTEDPLEVELSLYGDGNVSEVQRLRLKAKERHARFFANFSGASKTVEAKIALADGTHDDLPADDRAYALMPERRRARVQVVTKGNMYLEAALLLDEYLEVTPVDPAKYPAAGQFDVTIFDGEPPGPLTPGSGHALYLNPSGKDVPIEVGDAVEDTDPNVPLGFDEIDHRHPIVRWISLGEVNVSRAHILKPQKGDHVIGASFKGPLLVAGRRAGTKFVALGLDIRETDLPLRIAWPLLLLNTINDFVEEDTGYISSFQTGQVWRIPAPSDAESATLFEPPSLEEKMAREEKVKQGEEVPALEPIARTVPIKEGRAVYLGQRAGFYKLVSRVGETSEESMFAANLVDPSESSIRSVETLTIGSAAAGEVEGFTFTARRELWVYLLAIVLLITLLEWLTYHRRITV